MGCGEQPLFLNIVCRVATSFSPENLLYLVKDIETKLGRAPGSHNIPRTIDIDILLYGNKSITTSQLTIPHPRLKERAFVLLPLADIASHLQHPVTQEGIKELVLKVDKGGVYKVDSQWSRGEL